MMCIYERETFRSRLIGWLNFISIIGILETTNQLIGYSVKVDSTSLKPTPLMLFFHIALMTVHATW